jgi:hypothetical protein
MSKHTPGPWENEDNDGNMIFARNPYGKGDMRVADIRGWGHLTGTGACRLSEEEAIAIQNANAHLIASAPELLEALKEIVELADFAMRYANRDGAEYDVENCLKEARQAIAKAEAL